VNVNEITKKSKRKKKKREKYPGASTIFENGIYFVIAETFAWEKLKHLCEIEFT
jgi:hypothetical protein